MLWREICDNKCSVMQYCGERKWSFVELPNIMGQPGSAATFFPHFQRIVTHQHFANVMTKNDVYVTCHLCRVGSHVIYVGLGRCRTFQNNDTLVMLGDAAKMLRKVLTNLSWMKRWYDFISVFCSCTVHVCGTWPVRWTDVLHWN